MAPIFGYWTYRGIGESIRCLLHHSCEEFEEKIYPFGPAPDYYTRSPWVKAKHDLGLDFPNLPYYIDGDVKISQSIAILRYLGRKHGLGPGNTDKELIRADIAEQEAMDLIMNLVMFGYFKPPDHVSDEEKKYFLSTLPGKMEYISKFLGTNPWILGDKLSYVDFLLHEALDQHKILIPHCLDSFSNLNEYMDRFENLPNVAKYLQSERFRKWPVYGPSFKLGGGEPPAL